MMMTNSAMSTEGGIPSTNIKNQITQTLQRMDDVLRENFKLKQEIACEKKRYVDLMNAFLEVRHE
jgi:BMFP domain-containing protein YqiC